MAKKLTQKQIKNMIRLLEAGKPGPNIDAVVLIAANWWKDYGDQEWKADIEDAGYLVKWLNKLVGMTHPESAYSTRLDYWLVWHGHVKSVDEVRQNYDKWQRTQRAMLDWMANELRKELKGATK